MKAPFDIPADLDTPVSAYLKLAPFGPRLLLESVEGGERVARYSFIGFGECMEVRLDGFGLRVDGAVQALPTGRDALLDALRRALSQAPRPLPEVAGWSGYPPTTSSGISSACRSAGRRTCRYPTPVT